MLPMISKRSRHSKDLLRQSRDWWVDTTAYFCLSFSTFSDFSCLVDQWSFQGPKNGCTVPYKAIFCSDIHLHRPYRLIYGRYLHFRILKFPLSRAYGHQSQSIYMSPVKNASFITVSVSIFNLKT